MHKDQIVGVDIGTSGCRAVLFEVTGRMLDKATSYYPILNPRAGWQEQDPHVVLKAFLQVLEEIYHKADTKSLLGIGLSSYLHSSMPVDRDGHPLSDCIVWADTRGRQAARRIRCGCVPYELYCRTGCPIHPMYPICKPGWFREHAPSIYHRTHKMISIKEYIIHELFAEYMVDWSVASGTGLLDIRKKQWDPEAVRLAELEKGHLSTAVSPVTRLPPLRPKYAAALNLSHSIPFIIGGADGTLSNLGVGAVGPHEADNTLGTGGAVRVLRPKPRLDKKMRTWCYVATPDRWAVGGNTASGLVYEWFIREFTEADRKKAREQGINLYELLDQYAGTIPPGSDGLFFLPFIAGARTPSWNPDTRGVLFGLSYEHTNKHILRAIMEGITYHRFSAFKAVEEVVGGVQSIRVSGGFVKSPTWLQLMADIYGRELLIPEVIENTAWGAACMALLSLRLLKRPEDIRSMVSVREVVHPNPDNTRKYQQFFARYQELCEKIASGGAAD